MRNLDHILLPNLPEQSQYTSAPSRGNPKKIPSRNRELHSQNLKEQLKQIWKDIKDEQAIHHVSREGIYLEFKGEPGFDLITKSLENMRKNIRLLNIRNITEFILNEITNKKEKKTVTYATVYVPNKEKKYFFNKIEEYINTDKDKNGKPKNQDLINSITNIRKALLIDSFWIDNKNLIPDDMPQWCEVWLNKNTNEAIERFTHLLAEKSIKSKSGVTKFPERAVKLIYANKFQLEQISLYSDDIAEYRRAKETADFFYEIRNKEQSDWSNNLLNRINYKNDANISVCILDTGINWGHPLLSPVLNQNDCQTVIQEWGCHDHHNHGTLMAGLAAYGNLQNKLISNESFHFEHCLESVKILPPNNHEENKIQNWGYITSQAVSLAEIQAPKRSRIICMAITSKIAEDLGKPSNWSAEIDQITSGVSENNNIKRLSQVSSK